MPIAEMVKRSTDLVSFRCSAATIGSDGVIALAEALGTCTHLEKLDLSDNLYGVEVERALKENLAELPVFTDLNLGKHILFENKGTVAKANVLKHSTPGSEVLEMIGTEITGRAAPASAECQTGQQLMNLALVETDVISQCLAALGSLEKLHLDGNKLENDSDVIIGKTLEDGRTDLRGMSNSFLSIGKSGFMSKEVGHENVDMVENKCFAAADNLLMEEPHGDGCFDPELYTKEPGKMMMEVVRRDPIRTVEHEIHVVSSPIEPADRCLIYHVANVL